MKVVSMNNETTFNGRRSYFRWAMKPYYIAEPFI